MDQPSQPTRLDPYRDIAKAFHYSVDIQIFFSKVLALIANEVLVSTLITTGDVTRKLTIDCQLLVHYMLQCGHLKMKIKHTADHV